MYGFIYHLTMIRSKGYIKKTYGADFWKQFKQSSGAVFKKVVKELPDIGESIFPLTMLMHRPMWHGTRACRSWGLTESRRMT